MRVRCCHGPERGLLFLSLFESQPRCHGAWIELKVKLSFGALLP